MFLLLVFASVKKLSASRNFLVYLNIYNIVGHASIFLVYYNFEYCFNIDEFVYVEWSSNGHGNWLTIPVTVEGSFDSFKIHSCILVLCFILRCSLIRIEVERKYAFRYCVLYTHFFNIIF